MPPELRTLRILWFAFMMSIAIFQVVILFVELQPTEVDGASVGIIAASALGPAAYGLVGVPMFMRSMVAQTAFIVRFACFESVALFGFVAGFDSAAPAVSLAGAVVAWAMMATVFPTEERYTAWEIQRLGQG